MRHRGILIGALVVAGCAQPGPQVAQFQPVGTIPTVAQPPAAEPGTCWARDVTPAIVETVTERVVVEPAGAAANGTLRIEPLVREASAQHIVEPRREVWFQTACDADLTPGAIASLQRALSARGLFAGAPTGVLDAETRRAIRAFQAPQGLDSAILSISAARQLGLTVVDLG